MVVTHLAVIAVEIPHLSSGSVLHRISEVIGKSYSVTLYQRSHL